MEVVNSKMKNYTNEEKIQAYLDWFNNYLTTARFAEAYDLTRNQALILIGEGALLNNQ